MKYYIEISEVHKALVEIEAPEGISLDQLIDLASSEFEENGSDILEYSHTLEDDEWTVRDENGNFIT